MAQNISDNIFNFIVKTQGLDNLQRGTTAFTQFSKASELVGAKLKSLGVDSARITGFKLIKNDAGEATKAILTVEDALKRVHKVSLSIPNAAEGITTNKAGRYIQRNAQGGVGFVPTKNVEPEINKVTTATDKLSKSTNLLDGNYLKLGIRAASVVPIWMAIREVYSAVFGTIGDGIKYMVELDKSLLVVKSLMTDVQDIDQVMKTLKTTVEELSAKTGVAATEIVNAFRNFKDAGIDVQTSFAGMNESLNLSIALQGDLAETSRILADMYNAYGDKIEGATTPLQKMQKITSSIAVLSETNTFRLSEFAQALGNFANNASNVNLSLDEMMFLLAMTHTNMLRSGTAGTIISRVFSEIAKDSGKVADILGNDLKPGMTAFETLTALIKKFASSGKEGIQQFGDIVDLFGERAARGVSGFTANFDRFIAGLDSFKGMDFAERMAKFGKQIATNSDSLAVQVNRMKVLREQTVETFAKGITGANDYLNALKSINKFIGDKVIPYANSAGIAIRRIFAFSNPFGNDNAIQEKFYKIFSLDPKKTGGINSNLAKVEYMKFKRAYEKASTEDKVKMATSLGISEKEVLDSISWYDELVYKESQRMGTDKASIKQKINSAGKAAVEKLVADSLKKQKDILTDITGLQSYKEKQAERLATLGFTEIEIEKKKLEFLILQGESTENIHNQQMKIVDLMNSEIIKLSGTLKSSFVGAFEDILDGQKNLTQGFISIGDTIRKTFNTQVSTGITEQIFKGTGIGEMFGVGMFNLKEAFGGRETIGESIIDGHKYGSKLTYEQIVKGYKDGNAIAKGELPTLIGGGSTNIPNMTLPGFGVGGLLSLPFGTSRSNMYGVKGGRIGPSTGNQGTRPTYGNVLGVGLGAVSAGMSANASGGAVAGMMSGLGSAMMGVGSLQATATAGMFASGGLLGSALIPGIGIALALGSIIASQAMKSTSKSESTSTNQVTSRIDVTNKELQYVNRNLIAMRQELTYIMRESFYFSAGKGYLEDEFATSSGRGVI